MNPSSAALRVLRRRDERAPAHLASSRLTLSDGAETTLHVATYEEATTRLRVVPLPEPMPLATYCEQYRVGEALSGGFMCADGSPAGELRTGGVRHRSADFEAPWADMRGSVSVAGDTVRIGARPDIPAHPRGDLLQAGPLLVRAGRRAVRAEGDPEGVYSCGHGAQATGRTARAALGLAPGRLLAVVCDGSGGDDAGVTLAELADALVALGARCALNLAGGPAATLIAGGRLRNVPRTAAGAPLPAGLPLATALVFDTV